VCYTEKPDIGVFMREWLSLYESKSGERGIFSREAAKNVVMANGRRDPNHEFGTNPCSEIILRPFQFCNLTEVVVRPDDTQQDIIRKAKIASILGTIQSTLTDFRFLRPEWTKNCVEERLLGVSMTGICDNDETAIFPYYWVNVAKDEVIATNKFYAALLGINQSAATTCVKPSGTVSQLVNSSSGIHPRYAEYYIRRVRMDIKDPICKFLNDNNVPSEVDQYNPSALVFSFPIRSPNTITRDSYSALQQLYLWEEYQNEWCEHKPSITVYVRDNEWLEVAAWVYEHMDILSGVSFLPYDNGTYVQAPYEEITKEQYEALAANMPTVLDWSKMTEEMDVTTGSQELACVGGACEL
jgi:ribonucleoside-diphosphate reductase alpha chain